MIRSVEPELLDELPAGDSRALRSRRDLCRLNAVMGNDRILARELKRLFSRHLSFRLVDIGAGDGEFMLDVARRLRGRWRKVDVTLVDRQNLAVSGAREQFNRLNWQTRLATEDVLQWLPDSAGEKVEVVVANLFLHQFTDSQLRELLAGVAEKSRVLIAVEPRRSRMALFFSRCLWLLGCNAVTRHDAPVSVRAGFTGRELSGLWPDPENWELLEQPAGWFTHLFIARRKERAASGIFQPIVSAVFDRSSTAPSTSAADPVVFPPSLNPESAPQPEP